MHDEIETRGRPRSDEWQKACDSIMAHVDKTKLAIAKKGMATVFEMTLSPIKQDAIRAQKKLQVSASFKDMKDELRELGIEIGLFFHDGVTKARLQKKR